VVSISEYGHIEELVDTPISLRISIVLSSAVSAMVQLFFADRVRRLAGNLYIAGFCAILSLWRLGVGTWATVGAMENANIIIFNEKYRWTMMFYALGTTIDLTIASSLCYFLAKHRRTSIKKTARLIDGLIAWTIETGVVTGLTSVSLLVCFVTMPNNFIWVAIYSYIDRIYSNSLLAILNSRAPRNGMEQVAIDLSNSEWIHTSIAPRFAPAPSSTINMTQQSYASESRSNHTGNGIIQKDAPLGEEK